MTPHDSDKSQAAEERRELLPASTPAPANPGATGGANGNGAAARANRVKLADALAMHSDVDLPELWRAWSGGQSPPASAEPALLRKQVHDWMGDAALLEARVEGLGKRLALVLDVLLDAPRYQATLVELANARALAHCSQYDLEAALLALQRGGFLCESRAHGVSDWGARAWCVPYDLAEAVLRRRRAKRRGIFDAFTLRGHLDRLYEDPVRAARTPAARQRELYKLYSNEPAAVARVERLPDGLRQLVVKAIMEFGGILPRSLFERLDTGLAWDGRRWAAQLEESLVGTVERWELGRHGIHHADETLLVFNEVALAYLRRVAVPGDPDRPHEEVALGVDLASNITRFIGYILDHDVRFTVRGEIFKTTEKRIQEEMIKNPGRELSREGILQFIYTFARRAHLIESTGERTFALTAAGREWEAKELDQKLKGLLDHAIEERDLSGEPYHQTRMRRILMRLLKRVEPLVWYDLMYVPFLARNTYLCNVDEHEVEEHFAARFQGHNHVPMEDIQRMAWNLVAWVRQRLHILGIVDLGYDKAGRPVAMRLTRTGARVLGVVDGTPEGAPLVGSLVVTPDFEIVLFPTGDDGELIHDLDRFSVREKQGSVLHFRVSEKSVQRALTEGMYLRRILAVLQGHSRTPVPQNVLYSVRDWAVRAGMLTLSKDYVVRGENPELLKRFQHDPGVRPVLERALDETRVKLKGAATLRRTQSLLRELGYLVELDEG
ncbi:MAG: helicase-associated domain-containing protein [Planctomycetes bacterium]|nr:helicase-associated domain-containing protein [Planctomycetota bacterium]